VLGLRDCQTTALDVWALGLVIFEFACATEPVFSCCDTEEQLVEAMCRTLGTPTEDNKLMPSYWSSRCHSAHGVHVVTYGENTLCKGMGANELIPKNLEYVIDNSVRMEPTLRASARWLLTMFNGEYLITPAREEASSGTYMFVSADTRAKAGEWLYTICATSMTARRNGDWRRTFHAAAGMLDRLVRNKEYADSHLGDDCGLAATCIALVSVASKLCTSAHYITPRIFNTQVKCSLRVGEPILGAAEVSPHVTLVCSHELDILATLEWDTWRPNPMDSERAGVEAKTQRETDQRAVMGRRQSSGEEYCVEMIKRVYSIVVYF
jgi:hypothetical protein